MDEKSRQRLAALESLKRTFCFCSECGKKLRYRSFSAHPCYYMAVERYGTYVARLHVQRLQHRAGACLCEPRFGVSLPSCLPC